MSLLQINRNFVIVLLVILHVPVLTGCELAEDEKMIAELEETVFGKPPKHEPPSETFPTIPDPDVPTEFPVPIHPVTVQNENEQVIYNAALLAVEETKSRDGEKVSQTILEQVSIKAATQKQKELRRFNIIVSTSTTIALAESAVAQSAN